MASRNWIGLWAMPVPCLHNLMLNCCVGRVGASFEFRFWKKASVLVYVDLTALKRYTNQMRSIGTLRISFSPF